MSKKTYHNCASAPLSHSPSSTSKGMREREGGPKQDYTGSYFKQSHKKYFGNIVNESYHTEF